MQVQSFHQPPLGPALGKEWEFSEATRPPATSSRSADMIQSRETSSISKFLHYTTQGLCTAAERKDRSACLIVNIIAVSDLELD